jgi:predicted Zn finger-like uncharacterized protein
MKIVCDACQAKYSISDDKVQGKVFKIRCKKCSNIIVVRGGAGAAEPAPAPQQEKDTRVYDYGYDGAEQAPAGDESVWHVVINQDQVGPMTAVDVSRRFASGEIDAETYIWREGFADWLPLAQVDTFAHLAAGSAGAGPAEPASTGSGARAVASMFGTGEDAGSGRSDPGDLFAAASASQAHRDDDGGDLFGSKPSDAQANQASNSKLRGERNENSVLFSLNNLAQLASDKPAPAQAAAHSPSASQNAMGAATGAAGGEGSGLIDIRSMASAYLGGGSGTAAKPASAGIGSLDDLPVFGGGGFSEPAVIVPMARNTGGNNKLLYALIGSVGLLAVAAVVVVIVMLKKPSAPVTTTAPSAADTTVASADKPAAAPSPAGDGTAAQPAAAPPPSATPPAAAPAPAAATPPAAAPADATPPPAAVAPPPPVHTAPAAAPTHKPTTPAPSHAAASKPPADAKPATPPPADPKPVKADAGGGGGCDEVSCVLSNYDGACCAKFKKKGGGGAKPAAGGGGDLPDSLDRGMISDGVAKVKTRVMSCGDKSSAKGQVKVSVKVDGDGRVTSVTVKSTPDPGLGDCVAAQMQKATFAKTQTGGSFSYPYTF